MADHLGFDIEAMQQAAQEAGIGHWTQDGAIVNSGEVTIADCGTDPFVKRDHPVNIANAKFIAACSPATVLALIEQYKHLDNTIQNPTLAGAHIHGNMATVGMRGAAAQIIAGMFIEQFKSETGFKEGNLANFLEISFKSAADPDIGEILVTVQRVDGMTPSEKIKEAREDAAKWHQVLQSASCAAGMTAGSDTTTQLVPMITDMRRRLHKAMAVVEAVKAHREMFAGTSDEDNMTAQAIGEALIELDNDSMPAVAVCPQCFNVFDPLK